MRGQSKIHRRARTGAERSSERGEGEKESEARRGTRAHSAFLSVVPVGDVVVAVVILLRGG